MNEFSQTSRLVPAGEGIYADLGDHRGYVKVSADQTNGEFMLFECEADFDGGVPLHVHRREDETFYILSGCVLFQVGDRTVAAGPGDTMFGPRDIPHSWRVVSPEGARLLIAFTPGANFQSFGMAMAERRAVPKEAMTDPVQITEFAALAARYGIELLPPTA